MDIQICHSCDTAYTNKTWIDICPVCRSENLVRISTLDDEFIVETWKSFTDIPVVEDEDDVLVLDEDWFLWKKGTEVQDTIWHWFDDYHSKGLGWMMENIERL